LVRRFSLARRQRTIHRFNDQEVSTVIANRPAREAGLSRTLRDRHEMPVGPALIEPLNDDPRDHPDHPAQKIRHPRNVRVLPPSRDFH